MREDLSISEAISKIDTDVEKLMDSYEFPTEGEIRFLMHINNMRLVLIDGISSGRSGEVEKYLTKCSRKELEELNHSIQGDISEQKEDKEWIAAVKTLASFLDKMLNRVSICN